MELKLGDIYTIKYKNSGISLVKIVKIYNDGNIMDYQVLNTTRDDKVNDMLSMYTTDFINCIKRYKDGIKGR